jgi:hypothetical protein
MVFDSPGRIASLEKTQDQRFFIRYHAANFEKYSDERKEEEDGE